MSLRDGEGFFYSVSNSVNEAHESLFTAVKMGFSDLIRCGGEDSYFLQVNSDKHGMIVLGCVEPVEHGQTVFWTRKSSEDDVSKSTLDVILVLQVLRMRKCKI